MCLVVICVDCVLMGLCWCAEAIPEQECLPQACVAFHSLGACVRCACDDVCVYDVFVARGSFCFLMCVC